MNSNQINSVPPFIDMHTYFTVHRNLIAYQLAQKTGRAPTEREIDIAELQAAWNRISPRYQLVVDGKDDGFTETTLRLWLVNMRLEELIRARTAAGVILSPQSVYPSDWNIISSNISYFQTKP